MDPWNMLYFITAERFQAYLNDQPETDSKAGLWIIHDWNPHEDSYATFQCREDSDGDKVVRMVEHIGETLKAHGMTLFVTITKEVRELSF